VTTGITVDVPRRATPAARRDWRRIARGLGAALAAALVIAAPWWGPRALARMDFFHVRRLEFDGVRFASVGELTTLLAVDTTQSVWQPLDVLAERVAGHPMVEATRVERRLPGTLQVHVVERVPVALVPHEGRLVAVDRDGHRLPVTLTRTPLDVPVAATPDSALLRVLDGLRRDAPELYARVTEGRRVGAHELRFELGAFTVRTRPDVTVARFLDIFPVEADLARHALRVTEFDLRFRDQVIVRYP
jgi:cell division protein FtsQ